MNKNQRLLQGVSKALERDELIIFVGAGLSMPLALPSWRELAFEATKKFDENSGSKGHFVELNRMMDLDIMNEIQVFDVLAHHNLDWLEDFISNRVNPNFEKSDLEATHSKLWQISKKIITTNYDKALEECKPNSSIKVISTNSISEIKGIDLTGGDWLFHLHGVINNIRECVFTSRDYYRIYEGTDDRESPVKQKLKSIMSTKVVLFVGFSMEDKYIAEALNNFKSIFDTTRLNHLWFVTTDTKTPIDGMNLVPLTDYGELPALLDDLIDIKRQVEEAGIKPISKHLRRRCRVFETENVSKKYKAIMSEIWGKDFQEDRVSKLLRKAQKLTNDFERVFCLASLYEKQGNVAEMINILKSNEFDENRDFFRKLYLAIGHEKEKNLKSAKQLLKLIIHSPKLKNTMLKDAAAFNNLVCEEKLENFEDIKFEDYFDSEFVLPYMKERIKDKAIGNHLIICSKTTKEFKYEDQYNVTIDYERSKGDKAVVKTITNYITYHKKNITTKEFWEIYDMSDRFNSAGKISLLDKLCPLLSSSDLVAVRSKVQDIIDSLSSPDFSWSTKKHIESLEYLLKAW